jgi:hypothetical protein
MLRHPGGKKIKLASNFGSVNSLIELAQKSDRPGIFRAKQSDAPAAPVLTPKRMEFAFRSGPTSGKKAKTGEEREPDSVWFLEQPLNLTTVYFFQKNETVLYCT